MEQEIKCPNCREIIPNDPKNRFCLGCGNRITYTTFGKHLIWIDSTPPLEEIEKNSNSTIEDKKWYKSFKLPSFSKVKIDTSRRRRRQSVRLQSSTETPTEKLPPDKALVVEQPKEKPRRKRIGLLVVLPVVMILCFVSYRVIFSLEFNGQTSAPSNPPEITEKTPIPTPIAEKKVEQPLKIEKDFEVHVTDSKGKEGDIGIGIIDKIHTWETGSTTRVKGVGDLSILGVKALDQELQDKLQSSLEVIVDGTADVRNTLGGHQVEVVRADDRATTLFKVVNEIKKDQDFIKRLNLGQWKCEKTAPLEDQRRIVFIWLKRKDKGFNLQEGVKQALEKRQSEEPIFEDMLKCYSDFKLN